MEAESKWWFVMNENALKRLKEMGGAWLAGAYAIGFFSLFLLAIWKLYEVVFQGYLYVLIGLGIVFIPIFTSMILFPKKVEHA